MNSEDTGIQTILCGMFGEKIETPDSKEFQIHSFSGTTNVTFSRNIKSDLKEEQGDANDSHPVWRPASTLQDVSSVKSECPDRDRNVLEHDSSGISKATSSTQLEYKKKGPRRQVGTGLKIHHRSHTGGRPFCCAICTKSFQTSRHLKTHLRVHTGVRPFCCEICSKSFNQSGNFKSHLRVHTGDRPF